MSAPAWPLFGHQAVETAFLDGFASGRLHHGWLIEGPSGVGKAIFAQRIGAYALGARGPDSAPLDAPADDAVVQKLISGAHPDCIWLRRKPDDKGKLPQDIRKEEVARLLEFFQLRPALGGWRIGIVDSYDELNRFGANALLKTLEEPPRNCLLLLISHGNQPVLPTIRSRCRRARLSRLGDDDMRLALDAVGQRADDALLAIADGRPGHGLAMIEPASRRAVQAADRLARELPAPGAAVLSESIEAASVSETAFDAFSQTLLKRIEQGASERNELAETWLTLSALLAQAREMTMDRAQTTAKIVSTLQKARISV